MNYALLSGVVSLVGVLMAVGVVGFTYVMFRARGRDEQLYAFGLVWACTCAFGALIAWGIVIYLKISP